MSDPHAEDVTEAAPAGHVALETLDRYLAAAAQDREAAEERSTQIVDRFTKLTIAMMCVTMVIAGANVAMLIKQASAPRPVVVLPPRPVEAPTALVQPAQPVVLPAPAVPSEPAPPPEKIEKIPLLGSPPSARVRRAPAPGPSKLARTAPPRPLPLLSARNTDDDARESGPVERW